MATPGEVRHPSLPKQRSGLRRMKLRRGLVYVVYAIAGATLAACSGKAPPETLEQIRARLQPVGQVCRTEEACPQNKAAAPTAEPAATSASPATTVTGSAAPAEAAPEARPNALEPASDEAATPQSTPAAATASETTAPPAATETPSPAATATASPGPGAGRSGKQIYELFCFVCHATGVSEAPLLGDREKWQPSIDKGMDAMLATSLAGLNLMPPKGACVDCSEEEMRAAIQYMIDQIP